MCLSMTLHLTAEPNTLYEEGGKGVGAGGREFIRVGRGGRG